MVPPQLTRSNPNRTWYTWATNEMRIKNESKTRSNRKIPNSTATDQMNPSSEIPKGIEYSHRCRRCWELKRIPRHHPRTPSSTRAANEATRRRRRPCRAATRQQQGSEIEGDRHAVNKAVKNPNSRHNGLLLPSVPPRHAGLTVGPHGQKCC